MLPLHRHKRLAPMLALQRRTWCAAAAVAAQPAVSADGAHDASYEAARVKPAALSGREPLHSLFEGPLPAIPAVPTPPADCARRDVACPWRRTTRGGGGDGCGGGCGGGDAAAACFACAAPRTKSLRRGRRGHHARRDGARPGCTRHPAAVAAGGRSHGVEPPMRTLAPALPPPTLTSPHQVGAADATPNSGPSPNPPLPSPHLASPARLT